VDAAHHGPLAGRTWDTCLWRPWARGRSICGARFRAGHSELVSHPRETAHHARHRAHARLGVAQQPPTRAPVDFAPYRPKFLPCYRNANSENSRLGLCSRSSKSAWAATGERGTCAQISVEVQWRKATRWAAKEGARCCSVNDTMRVGRRRGDASSFHWCGRSRARHRPTAAAAFRRNSEPSLM
jgi:hypothetical protein